MEKTYWEDDYNADDLMPHEDTYYTDSYIELVRDNKMSKPKLKISSVVKRPAVKKQLPKQVVQQSQPVIPAVIPEVTQQIKIDEEVKRIIDNPIFKIAATPNDILAVNDDGVQVRPSLIGNLQLDTKNVLTIVLILAFFSQAFSFFLSTGKSVLLLVALIYAIKFVNPTVGRMIQSLIVGIISFDFSNIGGYFSSGAKILLNKLKK
jgi:hypothetical protein